MKKILDSIKAKFKAIPSDRWFAAIFFFVLMLLAFLFGKGCNQPETVLNQIDSTHILEKAELQHKITLQEQTIESQKGTIKLMDADLQKARKEMTKAMNKASTAIEMYQQAKLTTDTSAMIQFCDSAINSHILYSQAVETFARTSDSIINRQSEVIQSQDKLITTQRQRISLTDAQLNKSFHENSVLLYDNQGLQKKLAKKKCRFIKGVLTGIAGVMGALILIK